MIAKELSKFAAAGLGLVALYLLLRYATGAAGVIQAGGGTLASVYKTLQGR